MAGKATFAGVIFAVALAPLMVTIFPLETTMFSLHVPETRNVVASPAAAESILC